MRLLILTNNLDVVNGITTFIYQQSKILIQKYNYDIYIAYSEGDAYKKFEKLGVKLINKKFFCFEQRSPLNFTLSVLFCIYIILKYRIDVINPQIHYAAAYSFYSARIVNRAFIQTVHAILINPGRLKPIYGKNYFAINNSIVNYLVKTINNAKITLIRCPFIILNNEVKKTKKLKVISSGRLVKEKSFEIYLNAIALLNESMREKVEFYISGIGDFQDELKRMRDELKIDVVFTGLIENIEEFYENTHIFVMSTGNPNEGLGLGIIQAALKRNLIITPAYQSIKELLNDSIDGFMFNLGNSQELALLLEKAIENYEEMKMLAHNFYLKIKDEFSYERNGEILNRIFKALI